MIEYLLRLLSFIPNDYIVFAIFLCIVTWGSFTFLAWGKQRLYLEEHEENTRQREKWRKEHEARLRKERENKKYIKEKRNKKK